MTLVFIALSLLWLLGLPLPFLWKTMKKNYEAHIIFVVQNERIFFVHIFSSNMYRVAWCYTVLHMFTQVLFWAGNQGNHLNFDTSLLPKKLWLIFMGMKQKKIFFWKIKFKMANSKNWVFQFRQFSISFRKNFMDSSLG